MVPFSNTHRCQLPVWKLSLVLITFFTGVIRNGNDNFFCQAQECANDQVNRPEAQVILNGKTILIEGPESPFRKRYDTYSPALSESTATQDMEDGALAYYILQEQKPVFYVPNFLNASITEELKGFCITDGRFQRSPIRGKIGKKNEKLDDATFKTVEQHEKRTSESCVLIPAAVYLSNPKYQAMLEQDPRPPMVAKVAREVDVSMDVASRASYLLGVDVVTVEPLQLVRYTTPDAQYQLHHDHGGYYNNKMEARLWTMLIFLSDMEPDAGGHTAFPKLGLEVVPRNGDALVWSNVDQNNVVDPDMVHMGLPPSKENVEKYAVNVWFGEESYFNRIAGGEWKSE